MTKSYRFCFQCNAERNPSSGETTTTKSNAFGIDTAGSQPVSTAHFRSSGGERLSATKRAEHFSSSTGHKVSAQKMNKIIEEIGWTRGYSGGGYEPTKQGLRKDVIRLESQRGTPYCAYPAGIIHDLALISRFADIAPASARFFKSRPFRGSVRKAIQEIVCVIVANARFWVNRRSIKLEMVILCEAEVRL